MRRNVAPPQHAKMMNTAYLSLGSNIEPEENMVAAVKLLAELTYLVAVSPVWETKPIGLTSQPNFLNAAAIVKTNLGVERFIENVAHNIERRTGRLRQPNKNVPRTIDIDLILFNRQVLQLEPHHIPSPDLLNRAFVAIPLASIAPDVYHPVTGQTLQEIAAGFEIAPDDMQLRQRMSEAVSMQAVPDEKAR
jgi:2-amino-4-hydroxy-6-hydroxymethyldihydropteridine diphosphokinase